MTTGAGPAAGEIELLRGSLRRLLTETENGQVPAALAATGWTDLYRDEPGTAAGALFAIQGELLIATPALAALMSSELEPGSSSDRERDPLSGTLPAHILLPPFGDYCGPPGRLAEDGSVTVDAVAHPCGEPLLVAASGPGVGVTLVRLETGTLTVTAPGGIDPDLGLHRISGIVPASGVTPIDRADAPARWERAVSIGRQCIAQEIVGNARAALATATGYARTRTQFGAPIGSFQAIKHRLADAEVSLQVAEVAVEEGWRNPAPFTALMAKILAGTAGREVNKQVQQVLGGIGFTWSTASITACAARSRSTRYWAAPRPCGRSWAWDWSAPAGCPTWARSSPERLQGR